MPRSNSPTCLLAAGLLAGLGAAANAEGAGTQPPDLSSKLAGWVAANTGFVPVKGSPAPVASDPAHPYISNAAARRAGGQPTYRIADAANPNLKPWAAAAFAT